MATNNKTTIKLSSRKTKLEKQYEELFQPLNTQPEISDNNSLAQPSPYENIMGVVTDGAYEKPVLG